MHLRKSGEEYIASDDTPFRVLSEASAYVRKFDMDRICIDIMAFNKNHRGPLSKADVEYLERRFSELEDTLNSRTEVL